MNNAIQTALVTPFLPSTRSHILRVVASFPAIPSTMPSSSNDPMAFLNLSSQVLDIKWSKALDQLKAMACAQAGAAQRSRKRKRSL
jgi:hypothetical protein